MKVDLKKIKTALSVGKAQFDFSDYRLSEDDFVKVLDLIITAKENQITHLSFAAQYAAVWKIKSKPDGGWELWKFNSRLHVRLAEALARHADSLISLDLSRCNFAFNTTDEMTLTLPEGSSVQTSSPTKIILTLKKLQYLNLSNSFFKLNCLEDLKKTMAEQDALFVCHNCQILPPPAEGTILERRDDIELTELALSSEEKKKELFVEESAEGTWWKQVKKWDPQSQENDPTVSFVLAQSLLASNFPTKEVAKDKYRLAMILLLQAEGDDATLLLQKVTQGFLSPDCKMSVNSAAVSLPKKAEKLIRLHQLKALVNTEILRLEQQQIISINFDSEEEESDEEDLEEKQKEVTPFTKEKTFTSVQQEFMRHARDFFSYLEDLPPAAREEIAGNDSLKEIHHALFQAKSRSEEIWPLSFLIYLKRNFAKFSLDELRKHCQHLTLKALLKREFNTDAILLYEDLLLSSVKNEASQSKNAASTSTSHTSPPTSLEEDYVELVKKLLQLFNQVLIPGNIAELSAAIRREVKQKLKEKNCSELMIKRVLATYEDKLLDPYEESLFLQQVLAAQDPDLSLLTKLVDIYSFELSSQQRTILLRVLQHRKALDEDFVSRIFGIYLDQQLAQYFLHCFYAEVARYLSASETNATAKQKLLDFIKQIIDYDDSVDLVTLLNTTACDNLDFSENYAVLFKKAMVHNWQSIALRIPMTQQLASGRTGLHFAAEAGHFTLVQGLLPHFKKAKQLNVTDYSGRTALHLACQAGHQEVILILCIEGADRTIKDVSGKQAMDLLGVKKADYQSLGQFIDILRRYQRQDVNAKKALQTAIQNPNKFSFKTVGQQASLLKLIKLAIKLNCCPKAFLDDFKSLHPQTDNRFDEEKDLAPDQESREKQTLLNT